MVTTQSERLDPRIGVLNSGKFYAFVHGYDKPETVGTREEVEVALGLRTMPVATAPADKARSAPTKKTWTVTLRYEHPSWDEVDGIPYPGITAHTKREANARARRQAEQDGHVIGRGRVWFTAVEDGSDD